MKQFRVILSHDDGLATFIIDATGIIHAVTRVMQIEKCPESAIIKIEEIIE